MGTEAIGEHNFGSERQESNAEKAERIVQEELKRIPWSEKELNAALKGASQKVIIARRVRMETTMTLKWIAQRLHMGTWTHVSNLLCQ
jgi:hypothetical protein